MSLDFKASQNFIANFKHDYGISSRKVEKYATNKHIMMKDQLEKNAQEFRSIVKRKFSSFNHDFILNADQTGFTYESASKRTLSIKNEKHTYLKVQSKNAITHSFTIMPSISLSGNCYGKVFICLKETSDDFGPIVKQQIDQLLETVKNVVVFCSKSGKMSNKLVNQWSSTLALPIPESSDKIDILLLLDSYTAHWNSNFDNSYNRNKINIHRRKIPEKCTAEAQPCDSYFIHDLKLFIKRFTERVMLDELDIDIKNRLIIIKLFSLLWDQLNSIKFKNMVKYSWYSSGYLDHKINFENMREVCFKSDSIDCDVNECDECFFIKCSHCEKNLCIEHFFNQYHVHYND